MIFVLFSLQIAFNLSCALVCFVCHHISVLIETIKRGAFGQNEMLFLCLDNNLKCNNHIFRCFVLAFWLIFTHAIMFTIFKRILSICIIFAVKQMAAAWKVLLKCSNSIGHVLQKLIFHHRETLSLYLNRSISLSLSRSRIRPCSRFSQWNVLLILNAFAKSSE